MKRSDRAERTWVESGWNVGLVAAICGLREAGWTIAAIAAEAPAIQKDCGNEAIRAAGLNGGPRAESLHGHMERYGAMLCAKLEMRGAVSREIEKAFGTKGEPRP